MREYKTGATRSDVEGKPQYEGYLSPRVLWYYGQYMLEHQTQEDGERRESDNWQKGIPLEDYMDSMWRHLMDVWLHHRGQSEFAEIDLPSDALCALMFNVMGYLHKMTE